MTSNACNTVSLYIPIISKNITEYYVKQQFFQHKIGCVKNVDFVFNNQKNRREAFIHFKVWFDNKKAKALLLDVKNEKTKTQFVYYNNKFWPLLMNKSSKDSKNENYVIEKKEKLNEKEIKKTQEQDEVKNQLKEKLKEKEPKEPKEPKEGTKEPKEGTKEESKESNEEHIESNKKIKS
tara:strand:+ start:8694 stop:9230 length:537 start_codon:yes stop_codon:yes gene_type:complete